MMENDTDNGALDPIAERAEAAWGRGDQARAVQLARMGLAVDPGHPRLLAVLAAEAEGAGRSGEAAMLFREAMARAGGDADLLHNLGVALHGAHLPEAAGAAWAAALSVAPDRTPTLFNLARLRDEAGRPEEALALFRRLLALDPGHGAGLYTMGNLLARLGRLDEALDSLTRARDRLPNDARVATNLGVVLRRLDRVDEALRAQRGAVALDPALADARWNLANLLLSLDRYDEGFAAYEARRERSAWRLPDPPGPEWRGESLAGKRLLVAIEQGAGDMIQAARWVPRLAALGARVVLEVHPPLVGLLATVPGVGRVVTPGETTVEDHDLWVRAFSLPHRLGVTLETLATDSVPYLRVPAGVAVPDAVTDRPAGTRAVGICWSGNPDFADNGTRACDLVDLLPLARVPGVRLFSLQKGPPAERLAALEGDHAVPVQDLADALVDFAATAAVMGALDLVVTTDTSVAHLAGALGRPCLLLLAAHCDWRWGRERTECPWYPSLRLARQKTLGDWRAPVEEGVRILSSGEYFPTWGHLDSFR
jgi:tetratricopeptide (TPR) repeat protein